MCAGGFAQHTQFYSNLQKKMLPGSCGRVGREQKATWSPERDEEGDSTAGVLRLLEKKARYSYRRNQTPCSLHHVG